MTGVVLDLFPGLGVLGMGFAAEGFTIIKGPDVLWGGDIRTWDARPLAGRIDGIIGGPPCPAHSRLREMHDASAADLVGEFQRIIEHVQPAWWLMENAPACWVPKPPTYAVHDFLWDARFEGSEQSRRRLFAFGLRGGSARDLRRWLPGVALEAGHWEHVVTSHAHPVPVALAPNGKRKPGADLPPRSIGRRLELQGLAPDLLDRAPYTQAAKGLMVGNAVHLGVATALARAVRKATQAPQDRP